MYKTVINTFFLCFLSFHFSCQEQGKMEYQANEKRSMEALLQNLKDSQDKKIIVIAHRGDWRNAPENSLQAIQNCIDMGVDMVEIDVRKTKDGHLVLMHDKTIDRTTTGKGKVTDWTLDSLRMLQLRDGLHISTFHKIPTLEEALLVAKDKILINLDKSYDIFAECFEVAQKTGTLDQIIIKGTKTRSEVEEEFAPYLDKVHFMPVVELSNPKADSIVEDYIAHRRPIAFEFIVEKDTHQLIHQFDDIRTKGSSVWVNSLWAKLNGGHDDEQAALDPSVYDWYIENNIDMIQTDRPALLLAYLRAKGLHL